MGSPTPSDRGLAPIVIRGQMRDRIVNFWLILIVVLGAVIVIADGLTRTPIEDREFFWDVPFDYEPCPGAFLLAGVAFPLMVFYSRKARIPLSEALFLWFVFCTATYTRDFSYLRWPGTPIFVTDFVLVVLVVRINLARRRNRARNPVTLNIFLSLFVAAGALSAARGLWEHRDVILVLRDSTLIVYPLFLFVGRDLLRTWLSIRRAAVFFVLGSVLGTLNGLAWLIAAPQERRVIWYGIYILISLVGICLAIAKQIIRPAVGWVLAGLLCVGLLLANSRSLFVSLAILLLAVLLIGRLVWTKTHFARLVATLVAAASLAGFVSFLFLRTSSGRDFITHAAGELASGVLHSNNDADWQYRLLAWKEAWHRFERNPATGEGFGVPFVFELADIDVRPHNTFLTVLYKMGLVGFFSLLALLVCFLWHAVRAMRRNLTNQHAVLLQCALLAQVIFCLYGSVNSLLESPFLASLFWAGIGLSLSMIRMLRAEVRLAFPGSTNRVYGERHDAPKAETAWPQQTLPVARESLP